MKKVISLFLALIMMFGIITSVDLSVYAEEITTDDLSKQMNYSVLELEYLMNTLFVDGEQLNGKMDLYEAVRTEDFFHREIYDIYSSDPVFEAITVFKVQTLNDDVNLVTNPQHFYSAVLMDILQNEELKYYNDDALKSDVVVQSAKALEKAYGKIGEETIESLGASNFDEMMSLPWKDMSDDLKNIYIESWEETYKYSDTLDNLDFVGKMIEAGDTLLDCMNKITSLYAVADYNKKTVEILNDMYDNTSNTYLRMAINDIRDLYADLSSPDKLQSVFANGVYGQAFDYSIEKIGYFVIKTTVEVFFAEILATPLLVWEIGTSIAEALFAITDSATCYMTLEAATLIEDELRVIMQQYRTAYESNKTPENAQKCREAYRLTLANIYYAANTIQDLGYAISGNGSLWGAIKTLCGSDDYDSFVTICDSTRSIVTTRYYKYSELAKRLYSELYKVNFEEKDYIEIPLKDFTFNEDEVTLKVGDVYTIFTNNIPSNANDVDVFPEYESSNPSVATVNILGAVMASTPGTTTITVTKNGISKQMTVNVEVDESTATAFGTCGKNLTWSFHESTGTLIINGRGEMYNYYGSDSPLRKFSIKKIVIGNDVTSIGSSAFRYCTSLTSVTIPDSVTSIGDYAFYNCKSLTNVTIPDSVTSIGDEAFRNCSSLTSVTIPDSVTGIGGYAFDGCISLTSVTIGNSVTSFGVSAFRDCTSLTSVTIGNITRIGSGAFRGCTSLTSVTIPDSVTGIGGYAFDGCISLTSVTIPDSVTSIGNDAFSRCKNLTSVTIPDSVTGIGGYAFDGCISLTSVTIPDSVISIGSSAFRYCYSLTSVTIGNSVTSIGDEAFRDCTSLTDVYYTGDLSGWCSIYFGSFISNPMNYADNLYINGTLFEGAVVIPDSVTSIGPHAFYNCTSLTSVTIPDSVIGIGSSVFSSCTSLTSVTIPDSVTIIGPHAFSSCTSLTSVTIPDSVTSIWYAAFSYCKSLTSVTIPDSVTSIGEHAFNSCTSLASVTIGNSVRSIDNHTFVNCTSLTSVTISDSVTSIDNYAFYNCTSLTDVYYGGTEEQWSKITVGYHNEYLLNAKIHFRCSHNYISSITTTPTCTSTGVMTYTCSACGDTYTETISKNPHNYSHVVVPSTCKVAGMEYDLCTECDNNFNIVILPLAEHEYVGTVVSETCTTQGYTLHTCKNCSMYYQDNFIEPTGHTYTEKVVKEPGCVENGLKQFTCHCADSYTESVPATGHSLVSDVTEPSCTKKGYTTHSCEKCDYEYEDTYTDALGHKYGEWIVEKQPTCTENGLSVQICSVCGENTDNTKAIDPTGHIWQDWYITQNPTSNQEGIMERDCTKCDACETMIIPALVPDCVQGIKINSDIEVLEVEETKNLTVTIQPTTASNQNVIWTSFDPDIVSVNNGVLTALKPGNTIIVAESEDGGYKDYCNVRVIGITSVTDSVVIDHENAFIYGIAPNLNNLNDYIKVMDNTNSIEYTTSKIGTGTSVILNNAVTEIDVYTIVLFGDVNSDGWYDGQDAVLVSCLANGMLTKDDVGEAVYMAADCNHDGVIDQFDVDLLNSAGALLVNVDQSETNDVLLETSAAFVEYIELIDQSADITPEDDSADIGESAPEEMPIKPEMNIIDIIIGFIRWFLKSLFSVRM